MARGRDVSGLGRSLRPNGALLSAGDVAEMMGMTKEWVYAETRAGRIPHVQLGRYYRYRAESIEAWIREIEDHPRTSSAWRLR